MRGFSGAGVPQLVEDHRGDTFRAIYTVRFRDSIYVLHVFQKKSTQGNATPQKEIALMRHRLQIAKQLHTASLQEG